MENIKLIEKALILPDESPENRSVFLSNLDHGLVTFQESVAFFDPPTNQMSFHEICENLKRVVRKLTVVYDFFAGRLRPSAEDSRRLEINCNGAGVVFVSATADYELSQLGNLMAPKPQFEQLVRFLQEENEEELEIDELPLLLMQLTEFKCGSIALGTKYNHCVLDGLAVRDWESNIAALTRGEELAVSPHPDRTIFRARSPAVINHPHFEYTKGNEAANLYTPRCKEMNVESIASLYTQSHLIHLSPDRIAKMKAAVMEDGRLKFSSTFDVVAARVWKARSIAVGLGDEEISTLLFPVDVRKRVEPPAPVGFAGNALIPGFARATLREIKEEKDSAFVEKVQQGVRRLNDEYVRSSIDWLQEYEGVPCMENSFSIVAWLRLGLEKDEFAWGSIKCSSPVFLKPGLVFMLPGQKHEGGVNICIALDSIPKKGFVEAE